MPRPPRKAFAGAKYHISVRGNGRQDIFLSDEDRERFLEKLKESLERGGVVLYAYALMTNHTSGTVGAAHWQCVDCQWVATRTIDNLDEEGRLMFSDHRQIGYIVN